MAIVMKSAVRSRFPELFPGVFWEWYIIENPFARVKSIPSSDTQERETKTDFGSWEVTRKDAMKYIEEHSLVLVHKTRDGEIYDAPDGEFRKEFALNTPARKAAFNRFWD